MKMINKKLFAFNKVVIKNTFMLYLYSISSLIFPLLTLPYLSRVLSVECYGINAYVKSCMVYISLFLEFGFLLSATREIVNAKNDMIIISAIISSVTSAKLVLSVFSIGILYILSFYLPILNNNKLFVLLSYFAVTINALIPDYLFRGLNLMQVITFRYMISKSIAVVLTYLLIKNDSDLIVIPILDILTSLLALILSIAYMQKLNVHFMLSTMYSIFDKLRRSFVYFISNFATTAFNVFNTIMIGFYLDLTTVAYWSLCMTIVGAAQSLYTPIYNGIYPHMITSHDISLIKKILFIFMPLILCSCTIAFFCAPQVLTFIAGEKYKYATLIFRALLPLIIVSFPAMLFGWPCLGAINRVEETSLTTICAAIFQISSLLLLAIFGYFNIYNVIILRTLSELILFLSRFLLCYKYRRDFCVYQRNN